jgi:molecular chaperone GrpE
MMDKSHAGEKNSKKAEKGDLKDVEKETVVLTKDEFEDLKGRAQKADEHWERFLRQQADFENIRKRLERDRFEYQRYAQEDIIADLLEILDDLERSVEAAEKKQENFEAFLKGIEMILAHLYDLLKKRGVAPIEAQGKMFDPGCHEALLQTETQGRRDGEIVEELQKGYKLYDRIIRTAKVRVAKSCEESSQDQHKDVEGSQSQAD